ncbi:hypothetical protein IWQ62_005655 [Dispira parvispora]|uniref:Uncharacterized protein n=1 Tax=Dispira parvispora TaxID=1520584 RepID=A0A9W8E518_9FUNG|nr:hypothetical protein IWQ62_005655 [Dispira parvispora]
MSSSRPANYADILAEFDILSQAKPLSTTTSAKSTRTLHRSTVSDLSGASLHQNVWATIVPSTASDGLGSSTSSNQLNRSFTLAETGLTGKTTLSARECVSPNQPTASSGQENTIIKLPAPTPSLKTSTLQSALSNPWSDTPYQPATDHILPSLTPVTPFAVATAHESDDDFGEFVNPGSPIQGLNMVTPTWPSSPRIAPQPLTAASSTSPVPSHSFTQVDPFKSDPKVDHGQTPDNISSWKALDGIPQTSDKSTPADEASNVPPLTTGEHAELITTWNICVSQGREYLLQAQTFMTGLAPHHSDTPHQVQKVLEMDKVSTFLRGIPEVYRMILRIRRSVDQHRYELPSQPLQQLDTILVECETLYNSVRSILKDYKLETLQVSLKKKADMTIDGPIRVRTPKDGKW